MKNTKLKTHTISSSGGILTEDLMNTYLDALWTQEYPPVKIKTKKPNRAKLLSRYLETLFNK